MIQEAPVPLVRVGMPLESELNQTLVVLDAQLMHRGWSRERELGLVAASLATPGNQVEARVGHCA